MAVLAVQKIVKAGITPTLAAAAGGGDSWQNTGQEFLKVANGGGSPITVTIAAQVPCNYGVSNVAHDIVVSVTNAQTRDIGPVDPLLYNDANGRAQITYSGVTTVTVGVFAAP